MKIGILLQQMGSYVSYLFIVIVGKKCCFVIQKLSRSNVSLRSYQSFIL